MRTYPWSELCKDQICLILDRLILARVDAVKSNEGTSAWREANFEDRRSSRESIPAFQTMTEC